MKSRSELVREEFQKLALAVDLGVDVKTTEEALRLLGERMLEAGRAAARQLKRVAPKVRRVKTTDGDGLPGFRLELVWPDGLVSMAMGFEVSDQEALAE